MLNVRILRVVDTGVFVGNPKVKNILSFSAY